MKIVNICEYAEDWGWGGVSIDGIIPFPDLGGINNIYSACSLDMLFFCMAYLEPTKYKLIKKI